ncbi:MAG: GTP cyclohydrolase, FolE2/MptA family, partial [Candidatus Binatia bacterium]
LNYEVALEEEFGAAASRTQIKVTVPITSLCPCSRDIADYGAHSQRAHVTLNVHIDHFMWIEELIDLTEARASSELFGLLKCPDEKYVTERAYDNPKFVEDIVRDIAADLNAEPRILAYTVECENFESIHNHSAYARIDRDKQSRAAGPTSGAHLGIG